MSFFMLATDDRCPFGHSTRVVRARARVVVVLCSCVAIGVRLVSVGCVVSFCVPDRCGLRYTQYISFQGCEAGIFDLATTQHIARTAVVATARDWQ